MDVISRSPTAETAHLFFVHFGGIIGHTRNSWVTCSFSPALLLLLPLPLVLGPSVVTGTRLVLGHSVVAGTRLVLGPSVVVGPRLVLRLLRVFGSLLSWSDGGARDHH